ncbi:hypothetical protein ACN20G_31410 (plasmid) [Streptomyces sp. BI20]
MNTPSTPSTPGAPGTPGTPEWVTVASYENLGRLHPNAALRA